MKCPLLIYSFFNDVEALKYLVIVIYHEWKSQTRPQQQNHLRHIRRLHNLILHLPLALMALLES